jgi:hypothetical protein
MSNNVECPFCGEFFTPFLNRALAEHQSNFSCPLSGKTLSIDEWNMRPPKKEAPQGKTILSEVEWLRQMVAALTLEEPKHEYAVRYGSDGNNLQAEQPEVIYASREGTGPEK